MLTAAAQIPYAEVRFKSGKFRILKRQRQRVEAELPRVELVQPALTQRVQCRARGFIVSDAQADRIARFVMFNSEHIDRADEADVSQRRSERIFAAQSSRVCCGEQTGAQPLPLL